ncbi:hypothetical protein DNTS_033754 [Danionella cerebrum]|uniref:Uncharacterized protein n=1 Tax=Danionella cerebrum TaxID=2873325 RepID=A0A553RCR3_9TELE|nr:hypothetical protein DNTS_033754 [Danionella translucida]TRY99985.1 hypothetical protein DNTS_033754 [Danionella translucida]
MKTQELRPPCYFLEREYHQVYSMCTGKCAKFIGISLYPLAVVSVISNIFLFFPDFKTVYSAEDSQGLYRLTDEIKYMGGLLGGGILVLLPAIHIHSTGRKGCCGNRCGMCLSILFASLGVIGATYSGAVALVALLHGPVCKVVGGDWERPFYNYTEKYLENPDIWSVCEEPANIVEFNLGLFAILLVTACLELLLCVSQLINGLFGCICGTCNHKEVA